jgi:putative DNA methylase
VKKSVTPFSLKDTPALIEHLLPVQKLSAEAYKEQMAVHGKTLTALGSFWKGRKPLILNKACILGSLLPATDNPRRDLEIFEKLMAMDEESFVARWPRRPRPVEILAALSIPRICTYFTVEPQNILPESAPVDWSKPGYKDVKVVWRKDLSLLERLRLEAQMLPKIPYRERVDIARRPEEVTDTVHGHIWDPVNGHLGTHANSFPELVEQLGIMRFGHRPRVADTFCGSGQIPFEAARLGCDVFASDLNPVACMLTWGAFNVVGISKNRQASLRSAQQSLASEIRQQFDALGVETDGKGWRAKHYLYCIEVCCQQSGWKVPLLPSLIVSKGKNAIAELVADPIHKRYEINIRSGVSPAEIVAAKVGTVRSDGKSQDPYLTHAVDGVEYRTKISTMRGDYRSADGSSGNRLRVWDKADSFPRPGDIFQERVYAVQWARPKGKSEEFEFRTVTPEDLQRERAMEAYIMQNISDWQERGWIPDMRIEPGEKTDEPIRTRGWTYWHHLFNPRQLLLASLVRRKVSQDGRLAFALAQLLNVNSRCCRWNPAPGPGRAGLVSTVFDNQALNVLLNYGCRSTAAITSFLPGEYKSFPLPQGPHREIQCISADQISAESDIYLTDPPYGDAVKYEEILEFFIAWLRRNPPSEFANWIWDSRRSLAIKGEDEGFRRAMVAAYKQMTECMPDNGIQVIMFTHQSGSIWADMANIVWASGLRVTAAWYVVTETESALRQGNNVKGTVLLVLRKRMGSLKTTRDDLAWEIQEEVKEQVHSLTGLNQNAKGLYRDENVFEDADVQMAGYAAALRVLTRYATIDGRDMTLEAIRPRVKGEVTFVDTLIAFAVDTANQCLVPGGIPNSLWDRLIGAERFYLKLLDLEAKGFKSLDNYQNFAKAFKVRNFRALMASEKANQARLKSATEFGKGEMAEGSELHQSVLRATLYALMELVKNVDSGDVLAHLTFNVTDYYSNQNQRDLVVGLADYLAKKLETLGPEEASAARVLRVLVKNQRLG